MTTVTEQLPGAFITTGPRPWEVLQRDADGFADVALAGSWAGPWDDAIVVEARVASEYDNAPTAGCDWQAAEMLEGQRWRASLHVPTGGLYRIETRIFDGTAEWRSAGDKIWHVAVGDLWVITGQSNAVGYGHGPVVDPPALGVSLFGGNEEWRMATHPIFDPTGTKHPANRDSGWVDVSPWLSFGREILNGAGVPIGLLPTALGDSPLSAWDPGNPDGAYLYDNMVSLIEAAGGKVAGLVWYQGCSDTDAASTAPTYLERFTRYIEAFRARYGSDLPVITAQLNRHLDSVPENDLGWCMVREAQRQAAQSISRLAVVPTLDLPLSDGIHTSAIGNVILGQRFARAALGLVYGQQIPWRAVNVRDARFDGSRGQIRVRFDHVTDHLAFLCMKSNDFVVEDANGLVPVSGAVVDGSSEVVLTLGQAASGRTVCHNMPGANPPSSLRDHLQRPVLAFWNIEVSE